MTRKELRKLIQDMIKEYTGTGASGGNAGDGNNRVSQRDPGGSFTTDEEEIEFYINQNIYGAEGGHYKKDMIARTGRGTSPRVDNTKF